MSNVKALPFKFSVRSLLSAPERFVLRVGGDPRNWNNGIDVEGVFHRLGSISETEGDCGSAKIVLIAIDRSWIAWSTQRQHSEEGEETILPGLKKLNDLRKKIEKAFPDARSFVRPGFDTHDTD